MATGTTVFSRVTVVAPRTRIDVALPADVAVADLMPMLLEMAKEVSPDGGARHGGWALAKLGDAPLDPSRTLASLGIVDGELLQLRKRNENPSERNLCGRRGSMVRCPSKSRIPPNPNTSAIHAPAADAMCTPSDALPARSARSINAAMSR